MKTARFALVLFLLCRYISLAQVCNSPEVAGGAVPKRGLDIPVEIHGGGIFVPVIMNDGQTYKFLLDSGFEESVLDPATVRTLHLSAGEKHAETAPGGQVETTSVKGVHRLVGGVALINESLSSLDLSGFTPLFGQRLDGVLGYDFLQQFVVVLDYQQQRLTLCDPASFRADRHPILLNLETRQPYIDVQIDRKNGKPIHASLEIDTGKQDPFSLSAAFARRNGFMTDSSTFLALKGVSVGGNTQAWLTRAKSLHFAGLSIKNPIMGIAEENGDRAGQLGYGVLRRFRVTFDYSRKQAFFERNTSFQEPYEFDHAGLIFGAGEPQLSTLTVLMVIAGTPASKAGLREGDDVLTIDGRPANTFTLDEARAYFEHAVGARTLTIRRGGSTITVTFACRRLV